jgi:hypothetical protein
MTAKEKKKKKPEFLWDLPFHAGVLRERDKRFSHPPTTRHS